MLRMLSEMAKVPSVMSEFQGTIHSVGWKRETGLCTVYDTVHQTGEEKWLLMMTILGYTRTHTHDLFLLLHSIHTLTHRFRTVM